MNEDRCAECGELIRPARKNDRRWNDDLIEDQCECEEYLNDHQE